MEQLNLENLKKDLIKIENKIKYLKNILEIIFYDVNIRGIKLTFENSITITEDILEFIRLNDLHKNKFILIHKIEKDNNDYLKNKINDIQKHINKLEIKDQYTINKLLLLNYNKIYFDFIKENDKEFFSNNFDKNNCAKKTPNRRKIRVYTKIDYSSESE